MGWRSIVVVGAAPCELPATPEHARALSLSTVPLGSVGFDPYATVPQEGPRPAAHAPSSKRPRVGASCVATQAIGCLTACQDMSQNSNV